MKKFVLLLLLFSVFAYGLPASALSMLYTFSSGDILAPNANDIATYGLGRIDFVDGIPVPTVVISGDKKAHALGTFTRNGKNYIYDSKVNKTNENINYYDIYDASKGIATKLGEDLTISVTPNPLASADLKIAPDTEGYVYAINGTTLIRYDMLNWSGTVTQALPSGYDVYSLVALTNNANVLYVWCSKRTTNSDGTYQPVSSDIYIYNRASLAKLNDFHFDKTGLDSTSKLVDDQSQSATTPEFEVGRGIVDINNVAGDKSVVLVVYDKADSVSLDVAKIIRIDEEAVTYEVIVDSSDIEGRNIDNESPIPDEIGGFYFGCYSGDANAESVSADSMVYHWNKTKNLSHVTALDRAHTTADLVIKEGMHKGKLVLFRSTGESIDIGGNQANYKLETYIWDGVNDTLTAIDSTGTITGVELEKPFTDGKDGIYFMMEVTVLSDDMDSLCHWNSSEGVKRVMDSALELEVENPPLDGNNGFYFVETTLSVENISTDMQVEIGTVSTDMHLYHCTGWTTSPDLVCDLGMFDVPLSAYYNTSGEPITDYTLIREQIQSEHGFLEDLEHEILFVGAGPVGGNMTLNAFTWDSTTKSSLSEQNIIETFTDEDLGGYADIATAVFFTESSDDEGGDDSGGDESGDDSSSDINSLLKGKGGCNTGMFGLIGLALTAVFSLRSRKK